MGRHAGFIAAHAALARPDVNLCLVPEVPFTLDGNGGIWTCSRSGSTRRRHAVVVVAEGAGQELLPHAEDADASGNARLARHRHVAREHLTLSSALEVSDRRSSTSTPATRSAALPANAYDAAVLPVARPDGGARRDGRQDRCRHRLPPPSLHSRADCGRHCGTPAAPARSGSVATGAAVDRPAKLPRRTLTATCVYRRTAQRVLGRRSPRPRSPAVWMTKPLGPVPPTVD